MAISSTPTLREVEAEWGTSGLRATLTAAGLSSAGSIRDLIGMSAFVFSPSPANTSHTNNYPGTATVNVGAVPNVKWEYSVTSGTGGTVSISSGTTASGINFQKTGIGTQVWSLTAKDPSTNDVLDTWTVTLTLEI